MSKVVVVMPAYNAEKTLKKTYSDLPLNLINDLILVDDNSHDHTVQIAKKLGMKTYVHPHNLGYGGNQKTCYTQALKSRADIIVMIHPDYQYDCRQLSKMIGPIKTGDADIVLGSRIRSRSEALSGGMPIYKYFSNRFLTLIENITTGRNLSEYHTGFRAFHKRVLTSLPFSNFSNDFVFDQQILISAIYSNFRIGETPVPVRYYADSSSITFSRSVKYGIETILLLVQYLSAKNHVYISPIFEKTHKQ